MTRGREVAESMPTNDPNKWLLAESTRLTVLYCLAMMAVSVGFFIAVSAPSTGPSFALFGDIPGWPRVWGAVLSIAGVAQFVGLIRHNNVIAATGCALAFVWYWLFGMIFLIQYLLWDLGGSTGPNPSVYPTPLYFFLGTIHLALTWGVFRYWKADRARRKKVERAQQEATDE